jgi:hypothetical protein
MNRPPSRRDLGASETHRPDAHLTPVPWRSLALGEIPAKSPKVLNSTEDAHLKNVSILDVDEQ